MSMEVSSRVRNSNTKYTAFQSRNLEIRQANDIVRLANECFPRISTTKIYDRVDTIGIDRITKRHVDCINKISLKLLNFRNNMPCEQAFPLEYIQKLIPEIKKLKLGNCGESGSLSKIIFAINGIDSKKVRLYCYTKNKLFFGCSQLKFPIDHSFAIVGLAEDAKLEDPKTYGKNAYIIDLWDGFADYVPNAFKRFEIEYQSNPILRVMKFLRIPINLSVSPEVDFEINEKTLRIIQENYPELKHKAMFEPLEQSQLYNGANLATC